MIYGTRKPEFDRHSIEKGLFICSKQQSHHAFWTFKLIVWCPCQDRLPSKWNSLSCFLSNLIDKHQNVTLGKKTGTGVKCVSFYCPNESVFAPSNSFAEIVNFRPYYLGYKDYCLRLLLYFIENAFQTSIFKRAARLQKNRVLKFTSSCTSNSKIDL